MLDIEFCMRNNENDVAVVGDSISMIFKSKKDNFEDRYYKLTSIDSDKVVLDNDIVLDLEEIEDFHVLKVQR